MLEPRHIVERGLDAEAAREKVGLPRNDEQGRCTADEADEHDEAEAGLAGHGFGESVSQWSGESVDRFRSAASACPTGMGSRQLENDTGWETQTREELTYRAGEHFLIY
ncbi:MAG: hypothetical protein Rubg2KO_30920 [Rubricoccaceae bacterium]